jgi:mannose-6-phosphate isomerase
MVNVPLYPLRFEAIYKNTMWGGRRLEELLGRPLPGSDPVGEAWILSDQGAHPSRVANGPLRGQTLRKLLEQLPERLLGSHAAAAHRFPLLLKFLDARDTLSVQVHPDDRHTHLLPAGQRGKTEAWVVLHADPESRIYAGLKPGLGPNDLRRALREQTLSNCLDSFIPQPGDCFFLPAGTVHALGGGVVLFEVQQNSDVTFRLYDWDRVDAKTGQPRQLHIEQALACTDFGSALNGPVKPVVEDTSPVLRERLVRCAHFLLWRVQGSQPFVSGAAASCRILIGVEGQAELEHRGETYPLKRGDVMLLPAEVGPCPCRPVGEVVLLEVAVPGGAEG